MLDDKRKVKSKIIPFPLKKINFPCHNDSGRGFNRGVFHSSVIAVSICIRTFPICKKCPQHSFCTFNIHML